MLRLVLNYVLGLGSVLLLACFGFLKLILLLEMIVVGYTCGFVFNYCVLFMGNYLFGGRGCWLLVG